MYKQIPVTNVLFTTGLECVKRISDNAIIPFDPDNTDYQQYLRWVAEGNQPLPADQPSE
jgi:hypothetical protein